MGEEAQNFMTVISEFMLDLAEGAVWQRISHSTTQMNFVFNEMAGTIFLRSVGELILISGVIKLRSENERVRSFNVETHELPELRGRLKVFLERGEDKMTTIKYEIDTVGLYSEDLVDSFIALLDLAISVRSGEGYNS